MGMFYVCDESKNTRPQRSAEGIRNAADVKVHIDGSYIDRNLLKGPLDDSWTHTFVDQHDSRQRKRLFDKYTFATKFPGYHFVKYHNP